MASHRTPSASEGPSGGGAAGGWRRLLGLGVSAFAWEFLRRNPAYRADFARWRDGRGARRPVIDARWGLRFAADPTLEADEAEVFWRPEVAPGLVIPLATAGPDLAPQDALMLPTGLVRRAEDGLHLRLAADLQLLLRGEARADQPLMVMLVYDQAFGLRAQAVQALARLASGRPAPPARLTRDQRTRLARSLVALDGALRLDSYRTIARTLFGEEAVQSQVWKTASLRGVTIRLVQTGRALMEGGYLNLLRRGL